jgi:hypothetical protein
MSIMHSSVAIHAGGRRVDIIGASVSGATGAGTFSAYYDITSGGQERTAINDGAASSINTWLIAGSASDYDIYYETSDGAKLTGTSSAVNSWLNLGTARFWALPAGVGADSATGTLRIRQSATGAELDSATLTLARVV